MEDKKETAVVTRKDTVFFVLIFVFSALLMIFTMGGRFKLGLTVSYLVFMVLANVYLMPPKALCPFPTVFNPSIALIPNSRGSVIGGRVRGLIYGFSTY